MENSVESDNTQGVYCEDDNTWRIFCDNCDTCATDIYHQNHFKTKTRLNNFYKR